MLVESEWCRFSSDCLHGCQCIIATIGRKDRGQPCKYGINNLHVFTLFLSSYHLAANYFLWVQPTWRLATLHGDRMSVPRAPCKGSKDSRINAYIEHTFNTQGTFFHAKTQPPAIVSSDLREKRRRPRLPPDLGTDGCGRLNSPPRAAACARVEAAAVSADRSRGRGATSTNVVPDTARPPDTPGAVKTTPNAPHLQCLGSKLAQRGSASLQHHRECNPLA